MKLCSECKRIETNNPDGICVICKIRERDGSYQYEKKPEPETKQEGIMPPVTSIKICIDCQKEFKPTSNVQKRCVECGKEHKLKRDQAFRERKKSLSHEIAEKQSKKSTRLSDSLVDTLIAKKGEYAQKIVALDMAIKVIREEMGA